ncbi:MULTISPECIES: RcnB family protein [unclassified Rhizobium]|uniref:RcnB family protein n=1 Tax=unclassified Rhizobium TaxID=2613769 RepID=UPI000828757C|nr:MULTISPECIES: RcnB family protein [unclassified Rhizobium]OCJ12613.1 hypothetical protein A6U86_06265 [Rhizobium sp. AC27/96]TIX88943.1 hypothetical protein BSK43_020075 [Rhizobium sp. P44RR-XXIV]
MKRLFTVLLAASILAMPLAAEAQVKQAPPANKPAAVEKDVVKKRVVVRKGGWVKGRRLSASDRRRATEIDFRANHLTAPPRGYHWVRINGSILLVGITSGLISKVHEAR